ncbi:Ilm1p NDAI_0D00280 [Naumovozyma dairenensis CBS 421]|uniref:Protein ILM1 n=1 Tax=Naumovozyma dairenensis (strain ATCC 10597 / BCRC 20456 / CBS 421 / NBRC 0211 / NRRL Y-12639) TaxID=1071378 RepID=G0W981_NAUDC|nr:hypothetical protein NDAI_0D00280 [Naumovozyma dairenensis CBS 421]CCD24342.1 hypothetical protein NDAI_0D00280 [Naumovozyma dairenensis CBS 421]
MASVLSSLNVLYFRITFLLTISYCCFKDVNLILQNTYFLILTQAMNLPALQLPQHSGQLGLFGILFIFSALNDIVAILENNKKYLNSIVPIRLLGFFVLTGISFLWETNLFIHNNSVFIYSFLEMWINFVIYNSLREEKNEEFKLQNRFMNDSLIEEPTPFEVANNAGAATIEIIEEEEIIEK